ncbi:hypothetical protein EPUS_09390 [Endocarpon pusillum Z07020]|uniref:Protein kinase domain-containing protein n=1 Tax=Endocarpon pusillum (strain Z07020 / HMAS-L-300199) TaxID=1263415 RepID=U1HS64_ENDPU|nr:uncharacterized protein EPUS_09390 [Endocarpon pusillum Z07020]ERF72009.1 hypothetical protein EPUS_09390 [Endocarpon pusillum Z07020]
MDNFRQSRDRILDQALDIPQWAPNVQQGGAFAVPNQAYFGGNTQYNAYHEHNQPELDSDAFNTRDSGFGTGDPAQSNFPQYQLPPTMGGATQEPEWEPFGGGTMRSRLNDPGPSNIAGRFSDTAGDVGVSMPEGQPSGYAFRGEATLSQWYVEMGCREPVAEEIKYLALACGLREEIVRQWFRDKVASNANDGFSNGASGAMSSPIQEQLAGCCLPPTTNMIVPVIPQTGFVATAASQPFETGQRSIRSHLSSATKRTLGESSRIYENHQTDHSEDVSQQVLTSPGSHATKKAKLGPSEAKPLQYQEGGRLTVIEKYLAKSPNRCHSSRQPKIAGQTYPCTSICGRSFSRPGCWEKHEELNQPQQFYICCLCRTQSTSEPFIHHRKDRLEYHMKGAHPDAESHLVNQSLVEYPPRFQERCGFCGFSFGSWKERCVHVRAHFDGKIDKRSVDDWQNPWVDPQEESSPPDERPDGPPDDDPNNPDSSSGDAGAGASNQDQGGGSGSGSGFGSSSGNGTGTGSSFSFGQSILSFGQSGGPSRPDIGALWSCCGTESCCLRHSDASGHKGDHEGRSPKLGTLFHRLDILGCGSHSVVEKVQHFPTGRTFARKTLRNPGKGTSTIQQFLAEVAIMKRLNHRHIIRFVVEYADRLSRHVVMSPVAEHNLKEFIEYPESLPHNRFLLKSIGCLASALAYLHSIRVRHKDIKPQNILVKDSTVLLSDFGISKTWSDTQSMSESISAMTPMYAAPEVAAHERHDTKADVFSLGLVFLEIIAVTHEGSVNRLRSYLSSSQDYSMTRNVDTSKKSSRKPKVKPYYANIRPILNWIISLRSHCVAGILVLLDLCHSMVQRDPIARPTAFGLTQSVPSAFMCDWCLRGIRRERDSVKIQFQIALPDPFTRSKSSRFPPEFVLPKAVSMLAHDFSIHSKAMVRMCDISLVKLFAGAIYPCNSNSPSDVGYIIGRRPLFFGTLLQRKQDAKRVFDMWSSFEESARKRNQDPPSAQNPSQSKLSLIGSLDPDGDLSEFGADLDHQAWDWISSQDQLMIDLRGMLLPEDPSSCKIRRNSDLGPILGFGNLSFIDTTNAEFRWWDIMGQPGQDEATRDPQVSARRPENIDGGAAGSTQGPSCPYHAPILRMDQAQDPQRQGPLRRFLNEGVGEQAALFIRPDNGKLSTSRHCTCAASIQHYAYPAELDEDALSKDSGREDGGIESKKSKRTVMKEKQGERKMK